MQYHLDTIPVWEVMEKHAECPFCALQYQLEQQEAERILGASLMEPSVRMIANECGFCAQHHAMLFAQKNRLGHALLTDSHMVEVLKALESLSSKPTSTVQGIASLSQGCMLCDAVQSHMDRYMATFIHLWTKEERFQSLWKASHGACFPHTAALLRQGTHLSSPKRQAFTASAQDLLKASLIRDEQDLRYFTKQFDYRNQRRPWGNSKTALERSVKRLRGGFTPENVFEPEPAQ